MVLLIIVYRFVVNQDVKVLCELVEKMVYMRSQMSKEEDHVDGTYTF
jgi:hypothetical protein